MLLIALGARPLVAAVSLLPLTTPAPIDAQESSAEVAAQPAEDPRFSLERPDELAEELERLMRLGIETREPNHSFFRGVDEERAGAPFDGSYDWHSCVIAHWALMVRARTTEDAELEDWVLGRLSVDALEHHGELMARRAAAAADRENGDRRLRRARLTFPYDEGWFLVLLAERAKREDAAAIAPIRRAVESRLLDALENRPFPENIGLSRKMRAEGVERYCGFYGSSLILYLQLRWAGTITDGGAARLDAWRDEVLEPRRGAIEAVPKAHGYDFLWPPALLALADDADGRTADSSYAPPAFSDWPESVKVATVHVLGMEMSRVWPVAGQEGVYSTRVDSLLAREELWARDFDACSHWVPQFLFIGEWLRRGRP